MSLYSRIILTVGPLGGLPCAIDIDVIRWVPFHYYCAARPRCEPAWAVAYFAPLRRPVSGCVTIPARERLMHIEQYRNLTRPSHPQRQPKGLLLVTLLRRDHVRTARPLVGSLECTRHDKCTSDHENKIVATLGSARHSTSM